MTELKYYAETMGPSSTTSTPNKGYRVKEPVQKGYQQAVEKFYVNLSCRIGLGCDQKSNHRNSET